MMIKVTSVCHLKNRQKSIDVVELDSLETFGEVCAIQYSY